ncbi:MAG: daunorubicin ABC transporter ATP-binding protein, partial [Humibacter sp.]
VGDYSGGMRRRLDLAISLIAAPPVLFLYEPTTGLDPRSRAGLWSLVAELAENGTTILLTTQYLDEAERLADRVGVIDGGSIVASGTPDELKAQVSGDHLVFSFATVDDVRQATLLRPQSAQPDVEELTLRMPTVDAVADIRAFLADSEERGLAVTDIGIVGPSLDDVFLTLTGHQASDDTDKEKAA